MSANSPDRIQLCLDACDGIPDAALRAGGLKLALQVARAALGLAPSHCHIDLELLRITVEHVLRLEEPCHE